VLDLKANPNKDARGHIIEAHLDKGRGPVATVLIQEGTLAAGRHLRLRTVQRQGQGHVRRPGRPGSGGRPLDAGRGPGLRRRARGRRRVRGHRRREGRQAHRHVDLRPSSASAIWPRRGPRSPWRASLASRAEEEVKTLNLVLKSDVQGSLEAVSDALQKLSTDKVKIRVIHGGTGAITESDIRLASASDAIIIGFNVRPAAKIRDIAEQQNVEMRFYDIIYHLMNEIRDAMTGMLEPVYREAYLGQAEVLETFSVPKVGTVAGCMVSDGKLQRNASVRLLRDGVVVYTGKLSSLRRFKDDVREVTKGYECGVGLERFNDVKIGDIIEAFEQIQEKATL
jgi:translation initiation factor IF-2